MEFHALKAAVDRFEAAVDRFEAPVMFYKFSVNSIETAGNGALEFVQGTHDLAERRFAIHNPYYALRTLP